MRIVGVHFAGDAVQYPLVAGHYFAVPYVSTTGQLQMGRIVDLQVEGTLHEGAYSVRVTLDTHDQFWLMCGEFVLEAVD